MVVGSVFYKMLKVLSLIWELRFNVSRVSMFRSGAVGLELVGGGGGGGGYQPKGMRASQGTFSSFSRCDSNYPKLSLSGLSA